MPFIPRIRILDSVTNTYANLEMKDYVKYLALMIDSNLSWKQVDRNYSMLLLPGTANGERGTGNGERGTGNECTAVTRLRIQNGGRNDVFKH